MPAPTEDMDHTSSVLDVILSQRRSHNNNYIAANGDVPLAELPFPPALTRR